MSSSDWRILVLIKRASGACLRKRSIIRPGVPPSPIEPDQQLVELQTDHTTTCFQGLVSSQPSFEDKTKTDVGAMGEGFVAVVIAMGGVLQSIDLVGQGNLG